MESILRQDRKTYLTKNWFQENYLLNLAETNLENIPPIVIRRMLEDFDWWYWYPEFYLYDLFNQNICARYGHQVNPEQVFLWHWSFNIIERILHKFLDLDFLIGYWPQFNEIPSDFEFTWGKYISSNFSRQKMWLSRELIENTLQEFHWRRALYIDNPNNPTGHFYMPDEIESIIEIAMNNDAAVIIDEAFGDYLADEYSAIQFTSRYPNIIVVRSMSKFFGLSGLRIGYAVMSKNLSEYYARIDVPFEPSVLSLYIWNQLINDQNLASDIRNTSTHKKQKMMKLFWDKNITMTPTNIETPLLFITKQKNDLFNDIKVIDGINFDNTYESANEFFRVRLPNNESEMNIFENILLWAQ